MQETADVLPGVMAGVHRHRDTKDGFVDLAAGLEEARKTGHLAYDQPR